MSQLTKKLTINPINMTIPKLKKVGCRSMNEFWKKYEACISQTDEHGSFILDENGKPLEKEAGDLVFEEYLPLLNVLLPQDQQIDIDNDSIIGVLGGIGMDIDSIKHMEEIIEEKKKMMTQLDSLKNIS